MDAFEAVSLPEPSSFTGKKVFSAGEANRALTLVRRGGSDIVRDYPRPREPHKTCRALDTKGRCAEAEQARQEYVCVTDHLSELKEELEKIGCELKDYQVGLVDFTSIYEGREVCLCWKLGEEKVAWWHELNAGYAGRKPVTADFE